MNILMIAPQYKPLVGGYERSCERLAKNLVSRGHQVTILTEKKNSNWFTIENDEGTLIYRWWCVRKSGIHLLSSILGLLSLLFTKGRGYDVWHVHQYGIFLGVVVIIGKILNRPVILKLTNTDKGGIKATLKNSKFSVLLNFLHKRVDGVIALTQEMKKEAIEFGIPRYKVYIIGNGIDIDLFCGQEVSIEKKWCFSKYSLVVFTGSLTSHKNAILLVDVWWRLVNDFRKKWRLIIVGDGPEREAIETRVSELGLEDDVLLLGKLKNVNEILAVADIFVQPSLREGLSNSLLEALSSSLPVVVTDVSGSQELVAEPESGFVVPKNDTLQFEAALRKLMVSESNRRKMGENGRKVIRQNYNINIVADKYEELYSSLQKRDIRHI